jgi:YfiH family protein
MRAAVSPHRSDGSASGQGTAADHPPPRFQAASLRQLAPGVAHGFSGGFPRAEEGALADQVRPWLERELGPGAGPLVWMTQPHGREIADLAGAVPNGGPEGVLTLQGVDGASAGGHATAVLLVKSADCVPVLAVDPQRGYVAALHAGWRGVAAGLLPHLLERWRGQGSRLEQVRLVFGPHIRACCFEVRQDCVERFDPADLPDALDTRCGSTYLSLETVLHRQARRAGLERRQIETLPLCTDCHRSPQGETVFASYRRSNRAGVAAGRNLSFVALLPEPLLPP